MFKLQQSLSAKRRRIFKANGKGVFWPFVFCYIYKSRFLTVSVWNRCREVLRNEILKYKGVLDESDNDETALCNPCPDFENSVNADYEAAQGVVDLMDFRTVAKFIEYLENCKGNVLVSGIGETVIRLRWVIRIMHLLFGWIEFNIIIRIAMPVEPTSMGGPSLHATSRLCKFAGELFP